MTTSPLLRVENLVLHFRTSAGIVQAVDRVDLDLERGKAIVILGESGCGKTSLAKAILRLLPRNVQTYTGSVRIGDMETMTLSDEEFRQKVRWMKISMVPVYVWTLRGSSLRMALASDVLPQPDSPRMTMALPRSRSRSTLSTAWTIPAAVRKCSTRFSTCSKGLVVMA
jgi:ATPase subunit of ABC transporter with duplicated ATPase domains